MPILSPVGRKSAGARILICSIYLLLLAGSCTMVYPFLLMLAGSTKSAMDMASSDLIPAFVLSDLELYRKHVEGLFNEQLFMVKSVYRLDAPSFGAVEPPQINSKLVLTWDTFLRDSPSPFPYLHARLRTGKCHRRGIAQCPEIL